MNKSEDKVGLVNYCNKIIKFMSFYSFYIKILINIIKYLFKSFSLTIKDI
jgi:hypothetical protein